MTKIGKDVMINIRQFADHQNVEIVAVDRKGTLIVANESKVIILKKLDIACLPSEKLKKYHEEGRIAFILDGTQVHFNKTFAEKNLVDLQVCTLKVRPVLKGAPQVETIVEEVLEGIFISHINQAEYDDIIKVYHEALASYKKASLEEPIRGKVKSLSSDKSLFGTLKHFFMRNFIHQMTEITRRYIESMAESREEERALQKADAKKQVELKERLNKERLVKETTKNEIEIKTEKTILEHQA